MSTPEHGGVFDVIKQIANYADGTPGVNDALTKGANGVIESSNLHRKGDYKGASRRLGAAITHIKTAAALGRQDLGDKNYGLAYSPEGILDMHHQSYRYGYVDN